MSQGTVVKQHNYNILKKNTAGFVENLVLLQFASQLRFDKDIAKCYRLWFLWNRAYKYHCCHRGRCSSKGNII